MSATSPLQQKSVGDRPTDWSQSLTFSQLDPSLGSLASIDVGLTADVMGSVSIESLEAAPSTVNAALNSNVAVSSPTGVVLASVAANASNAAKMAAYDGSADYAGSSGIALALTGTGSTSAAWQQGSVNLGNFTGTGSVPLTVEDATRLHVSGPANLQLSTHAVGGSVVTLQYAYNPPGGTGSSTSGVFTVAGAAQFITLPSIDGIAPVTTTTQTFSFADGTTGWSSSVPVSQFDPALGALQSVNLTLTADIVASVAGRNLDATASDIATSQTATVALGSLLSAATSVSDSMSLSGGADRIDQGLSQTARGTGTLTDASELAAFTGQGTLAVPISATGTSSLDGPGNMLAKLLAEAGATVTVSYTYLPTIPTAAATWSNAAGGAWEEAGNWSLSPAPDADVAITKPGVYTIDLDKAESVHSVLIDAQGATLVLNGNLAVAGDFVLDAGTIEFNGGTLSVGNFTESGGLLSGTVNIHAGGTISFSSTNAVGPLTDLEAAGVPLTPAEAVVPGAVDLLTAGNVVLSPLSATDAALSGVATTPPAWFIYGASGADATSGAARAGAAALSSITKFTSLIGGSIANSEPIDTGSPPATSLNDFAFNATGGTSPASQDPLTPWSSVAGFGLADAIDYSLWVGCGAGLEGGSDHF